MSQDLGVWQKKFLNNLKSLIVTRYDRIKGIGVNPWPSFGHNGTPLIIVGHHLKNFAYKYIVSKIRQHKYYSVLMANLKILKNYSLF